MKTDLKRDLRAYRDLCIAEGRATDQGDVEGCRRAAEKIAKRLRAALSDKGSEDGWGPAKHFVGCESCGRPYGTAGFADLIVPNEVWLLISPTGDDGGLLCPGCIIAAIEEAGITDCVATFRSGPLDGQSVVFGERRALRAAPQDREPVGYPFYDPRPGILWLAPGIRMEVAPNHEEDHPDQRRLRIYAHGHRFWSVVAYNAADAATEDFRALRDMVLATPPADTAGEETECDEDCAMCSGEFCATHGTEPCDCDTAERHLTGQAGESEP